MKNISKTQPVLYIVVPCYNEARVLPVTEPAFLMKLLDLIAAGSMNAAREKGQIRLEGKDYVMQDGDVTYFRFNV